MTRIASMKSAERKTSRSSAPTRRLPLTVHRAPLAAHHADPEVALMLRVQRDEVGAFTELVETFWTQVFSRFYRQLGDRQEAEDLAQEVFLRLYRSRQRYQPRAKFTTWLFHIAQNVARNALRTKRRHPSVPLGRIGEQDNDLRPGECLMGERCEAPSRPVERTELAGVVRAAVARLGRRQRRAVELFQFHNRSYDEIASEMDMSLQAAKGLLYRARNQLRACLSAYVEVY
jgi:RNA polymerase sigma-70 factor (ECF subfamily)